MQIITAILLGVASVALILASVGFATNQGAVDSANGLMSSRRLQTENAKFRFLPGTKFVHAQQSDGPNQVSTMTELWNSVSNGVCNDQSANARTHTHTHARTRTHTHTHAHKCQLAANPQSNHQTPRFESKTESLFMIRVL